MSDQSWWVIFFTGRTTVGAVTVLRVFLVDECVGGKHMHFHCYNIWHLRPPPEVIWVIYLSFDCVLDAFTPARLCIILTVIVSVGFRYLKLVLLTGFYPVQSCIWMAFQLRKVELISYVSQELISYFSIMSLGCSHRSIHRASGNSILSIMWVSLMFHIVQYKETCFTVSCPKTKVKLHQK